MLVGAGQAAQVGALAAAHAGREKRHSALRRIGAATESQRCQDE